MPAGCRFESDSRDILYNLIEAYSQQHAGEQNGTLVLFIIKKYKFSSIGIQFSVCLLNCSGGSFLQILHFISIF